MHKPSLGSCEVPQKYLGPIGSAVLTFIGYKQTDTQTERQAKYIYRFLKYIIPFLNPVLSSCPVYNKFTGHILLKVSKFWFSKLDLIRTLFLRKLDFFTGFFHFRQVIYTGLPTNGESSEKTLEYLFSFFFSHSSSIYENISFLFKTADPTQASGMY